MIEGGFILLVFTVSVLIYIGARIGAERSRPSQEQEIALLQERIAWHEGQLRLAEEKKWDEVMVAQIRHQLADTQARLAQIEVPVMVRG